MIREISVAERIAKGITKTYDFKVVDGHVVIEVPLKERFKVVSMRLPEEAIAVIDKTVTMISLRSGEKITRTALLERIVEALAEIFTYMNYNVSRISITCENENSKYTIVLRLSSVRQ